MAQGALLKLSVSQEQIGVSVVAVSADQPPLEQRGDEVDARHDFVSRGGAAGYLMLVPSRSQSGIAPPSIGVNNGPGIHGTLDEGKEAVRRDVLDSLEADATKPSAIFRLLDVCNGIGAVPAVTRRTLKGRKSLFSLSL